MKIRLITKLGFALTLLSLFFVPQPIAIIIGAAGIIISTIALLTAKD